MSPSKVSVSPRDHADMTRPPLAAISTTRRENIVGDSETEFTFRFAMWDL